MLMPAAEHNAMANALPWTDPPNPGNLNVAVDVSA
jgi:hypothetical protein